MKTNEKSPYYYFGSRSLRFRIPFMQGNDIKVLQELLNLLPDDIVSQPLWPDGVFGNTTRIAVKQFQAYFELQPDGIVGPDTFYRLGHRTGPYATDGPVFSSRLIKPGLTGSDVTILQNRLSAFRKGYFNRPASGRYDNFSEEAVKRFQDDFSALPPDGVVGPQTYDQIFMWAPLGGRTLRRGRNGCDTYWLQWQLFILGYYNKPLHGYFNASTEKSVRSFQLDASLRVDGIVGSQTYLALGTSAPFPHSFYYYRVQTGDSVFKIAGLFNQSMEDIIKLNNLEPPNYTIYAGQMLLLSSPLTFHLTQKGETLEQVARRYGLPLSDVKKANPLPSTVLLPEDMVVLPRYRQPLRGNLVYLNANNDQYLLKTLNLTDLYVSTAAVLPASALPEVYLQKNHPKASIISSDNTKNIQTVDLPTGIIKKFGVPDATDYLDWAPDNTKLVTTDGLVLDGQTGEQTFRFKGGKTPQWFNDNKSILYMLDGTYFNMIDTSNGNIITLFSRPDESIWFFRMSPDNEWLIFFAFVPPGRVTISYRCQLSTLALEEISSNDFSVSWGNQSSHFLLTGRDYYGEFFPWFYNNLRLYDLDNNLSGQIYAKDLQISPDIFSQEDKWFAVVLTNPAIFYNIKNKSRDIFIKDSASRLITRVTLGETAFSPKWFG
ncbi:MAG TPA: peptidoglycan-binding protein [Syntrophomonadaceae bacterium]|nr:peptidoglycan-binding protein [Syntrophomonadaceae bacterium]